MLVSNILSEIKQTAGSNAKKALIEQHKDNVILTTALKMGLDPFTPFHVVKVPRVTKRVVNPSEEVRWNIFIDAADR